MGMNFVALMKYSGINKDNVELINELMNNSPIAVREFYGLYLRKDFSESDINNARWVNSNYEEILFPEALNLEVELQLPEDFFLTFGKDTISIWHLMRWDFFIDDKELQHTMLKAISALCKFFQTTNCIITNDYNTIFQAFKNGNSFQELLSIGYNEGHKVETLNDCKLIDKDDEEIFLDDKSYLIFSWATYC